MRSGPSWRASHRPPISLCASNPCEESLQRVQGVAGDLFNKQKESFQPAFKLLSSCFKGHLSRHLSPLSHLRALRGLGSRVTQVAL